MDFLGVGPMELLLIVILALIILGPRDMQKAGRSMGRWMNNLVRSDTWKMIRQASNRIKYLPNELMREAGLEEIKKTSQTIKKEINAEIGQEVRDPFKSWKEPASSILKSPESENSVIAENKIDPPRSENNNEEDENAKVF